MRLQLTLPRRGQSALARRAHARAGRCGSLALLCGFALLCGVLLSARQSSAESGKVELSSFFFLEPSSTSQLTVINPAAQLVVTPWSWLGVKAGYEADIVSGATESVKEGALTGVDIVSSATPFKDLRHVGSGGLTLVGDQTQLDADYSYGVESDYRSQAVSASGRTTLFQNNTELQVGYAHGFDQVCTSNFRAADARSTRLALESSSGCFSSSDTRELRDIALDHFQIGWTQAWTPVLTTQLVASGSIEHGFLENPYRSVVISASGDRALENHPDNRARAALALRVRYYLRSVRMALGLGARGYRDTWDLLAQTYEASLERPFFPWLSLKLEGRFTTQTGTLFWSDDYTGGEPVTGPRGQYWSGDRELSPLNSYWAGAHLAGNWSGREGQRLLALFLRTQVVLSGSLLKTDLKNFTWGGQDPDDTLGVLLGLSASGSF